MIWYVFFCLEFHMIACSLLDFMQYAGTYYANTNFTAKFPRGNPTPQTPQAASIISVRFTACPAETPTPYAPSRGRGEKTWSKLLVGESFSKGTTKMCLHPFNWERNAYPILLSTFSLYSIFPYPFWLEICIYPNDAPSRWWCPTLALANAAVEPQL